MKSTEKMHEMHYQPKTLDQRPCAGCGKMFAPERSWQRFHSDACRNKWHAENPNTPNPVESDDEFQMTAMNPNPSFKARKDGDHYFIEWEYSKEEWEYFTDPNIDRTGMVLEQVCMVTHRAQKNPTPSPKPKGGPLSQEAAKMCQNLQFRQFIAEEYFPGVVGVTNEPSLITEKFKKIVGVLSRSEIDHHESAKRRFMDLMKEYNEWTQKNESP